MGIFGKTVYGNDCTTCADYMQNGGMCHDGEPGLVCNHYRPR